MALDPAATVVPTEPADADAAVPVQVGDTVPAWHAVAVPTPTPTVSACENTVDAPVESAVTCMARGVLPEFVTVTGPVTVPPGYSFAVDIASAELTVSAAVPDRTLTGATALFDELKNA